jgi:hypothetical protein
VSRKGAEFLKLISETEAAFYFVLKQRNKEKLARLGGF